MDRQMFAAGRLCVVVERRKNSELPFRHAVHSGRFIAPDA